MAKTLEAQAKKILRELIVSESARENPQSDKSWSEMSQKEKDQYVEDVNNYGAIELDLPEEFYDDDNDDRPHGYEVLDKHLTAISDGVEPTTDLAGRLLALEFCRRGCGLSDKGKNKNYKFAAYLITNGSELIRRDGTEENLGETMEFFDGWNSSFHDASWNGLAALVGYGETPEEAASRRDAAIGMLIPAEDPSIRRFKMRRLVRPGD